MSRFAAVLTFAPLLIFGCAGGVARSPYPNRSAVVVMQNNIHPREGTLEACVWDQVLQGVPVGTAIDQCNELSPAVDSGHSIDIPAFLSDGGVAIGSVDCGIVDLDPRARSDGGRTGRAWQEIVSRLLRLNQRIRDMEVIKRARESGTQDDWATIAKLEDEYAYLSELEELAREAQDTEPSPPGDYPPPDDPDGTPARTAGEDISDCERANEFVGECNRDGWRSPECQAFLSRLNGCADPALIRTDPDQAPPCDMPVAPNVDVKDILLVRCSDRKRYGPNDNPCDAQQLVGKQYTYYLNPPDDPTQPCGNPYVRTNGEEPCTPAFTLTVFDPINLQAIAKEGLNKLGGPIFFVPVPRGTEVPGPKPTPTHEGVHGEPW